MPFTASFRRSSQKLTAVVLATAIILLGQESPPHKICPTSAPPEKQTKASGQRLTPQQQRGLHLLKTAQAEALGLQPDMRAFVLWQVAHAYSRIDPRRVGSSLNQAFLATLSVEGSHTQPKNCHQPESCGTKDWLQLEILREMVRQSSRVQPVQQVLMRAEPEIQKILMSDILDHYIKEKEFNRGKEVLDQFVTPAYFPYDDAVQLMAALPPERAADRLTIFVQALDNFIQNKNEPQPGLNGLATMISRFWRELPATTVLDAIDNVLDRAKEADRSQPDISVHAFCRKDKTDIYFASQYEFRLFQLMPVLQELDEIDAEDLMRQSTQVRGALRTYPKALASVDPPAYGDDPGETDGPVIPSIEFLATGRSALLEQTHHQIARREEQIAIEVNQDAKKALVDAMSLPLESPFIAGYSPRALSLRDVAWMAAPEESSVAKAALEELLRLAANMPLREQARLLGTVPEMYLRAGDEEAARKSLERLVAIAGKLYIDDSDSSDPNQAFKAMWPSTFVWRRCVDFAARLSPSPSDEIIANIPDPEIKTFMRLALAASLLGVDNPPLSIVEEHTDSSKSRMFIIR